MVTNVNEYAVYLGAVGWRHDDWRGGFYPDDLPEDWLLAYYNTQFRSVFVPFADWSHLSARELAGWAKETQAGFRFVLEAPRGEVPSPEIQAQVPRDGAFVVAQREDSALIWFDARTNLKTLAREIDRRGKPLYLFSQDGDLAGMQRVATLLELMGL